MSTKSKLLAKTGDLQLPVDEPVAPAAPNAPEAAAAATPPPATARTSGSAFPGVLPGAVPRTGPGQMLQFRGQMLAVEGELAALREKLKAHEGALPTRTLDPASIVPSAWANRHADAFRTAEFERLKQDIAAAGGNVQPILVRPLDGQGGRYELVFGHRRHRACAELGLPVLATIETEPISDLELFAAMDRENRERADLSPYEQGQMYRRALDAGLYPSNRRLAEALGVSHTWVANVLSVADLPPAVLECFRSPLEVQHRHARQIAAALDHDRKGVLRRAEKLRQSGTRLAAGAVVAALVKAEAAPATGQRHPLVADGRVVGRWQVDGAGRLNLQIEAGALPEEGVEPLLQKLVATLRR